MDTVATIQSLNAKIFNPLIFLLVVIGIVYFLWGVLQFISASQSGDADGQSKGKKHMVWGVIGLTIMVSALGIMRLILATIRQLTS